MIRLSLNPEDRAQLGGWLKRERDHLFAARCCCSHILIPQISGLSAQIDEDLDFIRNIQSANREESSHLLLTEDDTQRLSEIARTNRQQHREAFWSAILQAISNAESKENQMT